MNMKHSILIFPVLALLAGACTNPLEIKFDQAPEVLILNAMLRTDDTVHFALLSRGLVDEVVPVPDAQLRCYVNGALVAEGKHIQQESELYTSRYEFPAKIQPGDEVRLEAVKGSLRASAKVQAPQAAPLVAVDTAYVYDSPYFSSMAMRCRLQLQDLPDQDNWYRLSVLYETDRTDTYHYYDDFQRHFINFGFKEDPILLDGYSKDPGKRNDITGLVTGDELSNVYCSFRDDSFADGPAEVEIHLPMLRNSLHFVQEIFDHETYTFEPNHVTMIASLKFTLLTISKEEYDYLTQINKSLYNSLDLGPFEEPIHVPSNVEGGFGFVSVEAASTQVITLPLEEGYPFFY